MSILKEIAETMQKGRAKLVKELISQALEQGVDANAILTDGLMAGMNVVGQKFKNDEIFVPEVLVAARAMNAGTDMLKPLLAEAGVEPLGKVVLGTVEGDLHDIGKNLVGMMMEGKGIEVIDLGVNVSPQQFAAAVKEHNCQIVACSALLTTTMPVMAQVVKVLEEEGLRDQVRIMIGGAPVTQAFCDNIGADAYTPDAAAAAEKAAEFLAG